METYKITYTVTTPRGVVIQGKCVVRATSEKEAVIATPWLKQVKILSIKRAIN